MMGPGASANGGKPEPQVQQVRHVVSACSGVSTRRPCCKCRAVVDLAHWHPRACTGLGFCPRAATFAPMTDSEDRTRVDKWLWAARFYKTRSLAAEAIAGGKVQVNGERVKRAKPLQVGDEVRIRQGPYEHQIVVRELSNHRGPAVKAAELYEEKPESRAAREALQLQLKSLHSAFIPDRGRPTKKDRREINRLKGRER